MKLNRADFTKTTGLDGSIIYSYKCNDNFHVIRLLSDNEIYVYMNNEFSDSKKTVPVFTNTLDAWNKFEELVDECSPKPDSSGGYMQNPQSNPNLLPLLAIKDNGNEWMITLFVSLDDGTQHNLVDFQLAKYSFSLPSDFRTNVFSKDWSDLDIIGFLKCNILFKLYDKVVFEGDKDAMVFLFMPESIMEQGGQDDGTGEPSEELNDKDGEPSDKNGDDKGDKKRKNKDQKAKPSDDGEPSDEDGEPTDEDGKPSDKKGKPSDKKGKPSDEDGEPKDDDYIDDGGDPSDRKGKPSDKKGKPTDEDGEPKDKKSKPDKDGKPSDKDKKPDEDGEPNDEDDDGDGQKKAKPQDNYREDQKLNIPDVVKGIAKELNKSERIVMGFFLRESQGERFLLKNNFNQLKKTLNLPSNITALELSQQIIKQA